MWERDGMTRNFKRSSSAAEVFALMLWILWEVFL